MVENAYHDEPKTLPFFPGGGADLPPAGEVTWLSVQYYAASRGQIMDELLNELLAGSAIANHGFGEDAPGTLLLVKGGALFVATPRPVLVELGLEIPS